MLLILIGRFLWIRTTRKQTFIVVVKNGIRIICTNWTPPLLRQPNSIQCSSTLPFASCYNLRILVFPLFIFKPLDNPFFFLSGEIILFFKVQPGLTSGNMAKSRQMNEKHHSSSYNIKCLISQQEQILHKSNLKNTSFFIKVDL